MRSAHSQKFIGAWIFSLLVTSCAPKEFPNYNLLGGLRILTVIADHPEVSPGDTVSFTPVLSDLNGQGRTLTYSVQACVDPGVGLGAQPVCSDPDPASIQSGTLTPAAGTSSTYTGPVAAFSVVMPSDTAIFAGRNAADQYNGVSYLVLYQISTADGAETVQSFLRVKVSSAAKTQKNANPNIVSVDRDGSPVSGVFSIPSSLSVFKISAAAGAAESYSKMNRDGSLINAAEELVDTWFISDGLFEYQRTLSQTANSWAPPASKPSGRGAVIVVVTRDGRGGAAFQKVEMN
jgi:hypothetical protein